MSTAAERSEADHGGTAAPKDAVRDFWEKAPCGEVYAIGDSLQDRLESHARSRYELESGLAPFARFADGKGKDVLEIGVGMGADHVEWAKADPASLTGVDLTSRAIEYTRARLDCYGLSSRLLVADAENLPFEDSRFDIVYSWGVLHHTPDTRRAVSEVLRVLRAGGVARVLIYHKHSLVGYMLYLRYGLLAGHPRTSLEQIYTNYVESPGTKAYTVAEARSLFSVFSHVSTRTELGLGDLLIGAAGQRHGGALLMTARALWPRWLVRRTCSRLGLGLLVEAIK
jgi:ubiquinone/menaquinone biosynthesis C-methylase UbiE